KTHHGLKHHRQQDCRTVYDQFATPVYNLAFRILQHPEDAQDISQLSFITAFNKIEQWSQQVAFGFWLRRIVINHALDLIKKKTPESLADNSEHTLNTLTDPQSIIYDQSHDANHYLKRLTPLMRTIIWLYEVEGFTHHEIGELFNRSESFSKSRLARAKQQLHQALAVNQSALKQQVNSYE
ncbi:MAG: RNA polymerase sigma factor, partial [Proteobacteria bacterium]